jgi:hypothetical protein
MSGVTPGTFCRSRRIQSHQRFGGLVRAVFAIAMLIGLETAACRWASWAIAAEPVQDTASETLLFPDPEPLDLNLLKPENIPAFAVTATTISETTLAIPSLWWVRDQFAAEKRYGSRLIENWIAYPAQRNSPGRVDFVVNRQLWSQLDYLQRYSFIHEFGTSTGSYGYNLRVFDNQANFLAAYTCDFSAAQSRVPNHSSTQPSTTPANSPTPLFSDYVKPSNATACFSFLDFGGKASLGGRSNQAGGESSKGLGTAGP